MAVANCKEARCAQAGLRRVALLSSAAGVVLLLTLLWQQPSAGGYHDPRGSHIDQVSIDIGPPGVAVDVEGNGKPAVGDRNGDDIPDAEGYDTPHPGDAPGACGNGLDDDPGDLAGDTVPDPRPDGVADDGCQVTLSPLEQCAEIIDDGVLNADEDFLIDGQDMASIDITVGAQPGPGGGIPADRGLASGLASWLYSLTWDADVIDVKFHNGDFLIMASGARTPFTSFGSILPDFYSPFSWLIDDTYGPRETGPGVIARLAIHGNEAGMANLVLTSLVFQDYRSEFMTVDKINAARVAVSKDVDGDTVISGPGEVFRCCPAAAVGHVLAKSRNRRACLPARP